MENIDRNISDSNIQKILTLIRDFSAGIAVNSIVALVNTGAAVEVAVESSIDAVKATLKQQIDAKNYLRMLAVNNLNTCRYELDNIIKEINKLKSDETREIKSWLNLINRYYVVFTIYQPSLDLLKNSTPSGKLDKQLEALGNSLSQKILGKISGDTSDLLDCIEIANNMYKGIEAYKIYDEEFRKIYEDLKDDMPFYDENRSILDGAAGFLGLNSKQILPICKIPKTEKNSTICCRILQKIHSCNQIHIRILKRKKLPR